MQYNRMADRKSQDYAMQFLIQSLAVFFGVYLALIVTRFVENLDIIALFVGAILGTIGLFICTRIIMSGIKLKK